MLRLLAKNAHGLIDTEELADVRSFVELNVPTTQETSGELLQWYDVDIRRGLPLSTVEEELALLQRQTKTDIQRSLRSIFMEGDLYVSVVGGHPTQHWSKQLQEVAETAKRPDVKFETVSQKVDEFLAHAEEIKAKATQSDHSIFFAVYPMLVWIGLIVALRFAYLPYADDPNATVSMFDAVYDRHHWLWGVLLYLPALAALSFAYFESTKLRTLISSCLFFVSAATYLYGVLFIFGDIGKEVASFWQDAASIFHPVMFLILTPLALYWSAKAYMAERRIAAAEARGRYGEPS